MAIATNSKMTATAPTAGPTASEPDPVVFTATVGSGQVEKWSNMCK